MPLLEIVRTKHTDEQVIVDLLDVGKTIKKTPIIIGNCTGFAVNRMFFPYSQAAILLAERGVDPYRIDRAISKFGMPMGPFRFIMVKKFASLHHILFSLNPIEFFNPICSCFFLQVV